MIVSFTKSSFCSSGACLWARVLPNGNVSVTNDNVDGSWPVQIFTPEEWNAFIDGVKNNEFDYDTLIHNEDSQATVTEPLLDVKSPLVEGERHS
jgi:hypothetical protein